MPDVATLAGSFGEELRWSGVPMTPERSARFAQAVTVLRPLTTTDLYWAARVTLVTSHAHLDAFDEVFARVFGGLDQVTADRGDTASEQLPRVRPAAPGPESTGRSLPALLGDAGSSVVEGRPRAPMAEEEAGRRDVVVGAASREERLATTDFADLDEHELAELRRLMTRLAVSPPLRPGRRSRRDPHGDRLDLRATLRRSRRSGGDPVRQIRRRRRPRQRRVVVLCDISGSMEPYARAYVQLLHATAGASQAEVFTFATRLTRLTRALRGARPQLALTRAASTPPDWRGGTRIGESLKAFLDVYGRRGLARGAVVVIVSDGWERDDPVLVGQQMARLGRLAHRIVWVNPRRADPRYEPLAGGMAMALPHCDAFVTGHTVAALREVAAAIAG